MCISIYPPSCTLHVVSQHYRNDVLIPCPDSQAYERPPTSSCTRTRQPAPAIPPNITLLDDSGAQQRGLGKKVQDATKGREPGVLFRCREANGGGLGLFGRDEALGC